jgi:hypothetical protein
VFSLGTTVNVGLNMSNYKFRCRYAIPEIMEKLDFDLDMYSVQNTLMYTLFYSDKSCACCFHTELMNGTTFIM